MRRLLILAIAAAALAPLPGRADPTLITLADDRAPSGSWSTARISVQAGSTLDLTLTPTLLNARRYGIGWWLLRADATLSGGFLITGYSGITTERHVELPPPVGLVTSERRGGMYGDGGLGSRLQFLKAGTYIVVMAAASDGMVSSRLVIAASPEVVLVGHTAGTSTFMRTDTDFRGTMNVYDSEACIANFSPLCPTAKAMANVTTRTTAVARAFGVFEAGGWDPATLRSYTTPQATVGPIAGSGASVITNGPPGAYSFTIHANAGGPLAGISAWGADITLA